MTPTQHIVHCLPQIKTVLTGVSYMNCFYLVAGFSALTGGLAWYIRGRGLTGVANDINNIKTDIATLKAKVSAPVVTAA